MVIQLALWSGFIALPYFMVPRQNEMNTVDAFLRHYAPQADLAQHTFFASLLFNIGLIVFFYIHHYILFDRFIIRRRFASYIAIVVSSFIFIYTLSYLYKRSLLLWDFPRHNPLTLREWVRDGTWFLLVLLISLGLKLLTQWRQAEQRTREIETEQLRTELSFLHAQINPHFLFNSLNTIYSLSLKKSDQAPLAVLKLSQLLRYVIDESKREKVPLDQEIEYINNYIELQKFRSTSSLVVNFKLEGDTGSSLIAPLLLLPFVENAFKYGISSKEISPIDIVLTITDGRFEFSVRNKKFMQSDKPSTGIGINNVQRRLKLLYDDQHELEINDLPDSYFVKLTIHKL